MLHNIYIWNILGDQHSVSCLPTGPDMPVYIYQPYALVHIAYFQ